MNWLLNLLLKIKPNFEKGGNLHKYYPIFEATETILFSTDERTSNGPHIRDSLDIKRVMILVVLSLSPCYIFGILNIGYQFSLSHGEEYSWVENALIGLKTTKLVQSNHFGDFLRIKSKVVIVHPNI